MTVFFSWTLMFNLYFKTKPFFFPFLGEQNDLIWKVNEETFFDISLFHNWRHRERNRLIFPDFFCTLILRMEWAMAWQSLFPPHWLWRKSRSTLSLSNTDRSFLGWVTLHIQDYYLWQKERQVCRWWERQLPHDNVILTQPHAEQSVTLLALIYLLWSETCTPQFPHPAQLISLRLV